MPFMRAGVFSADLVKLFGLACMPSNQCKQCAPFGRRTALRAAAVASR